MDILDHLTEKEQEVMLAMLSGLPRSEDVSTFDGTHSPEEVVSVAGREYTKEEMAEVRIRLRKAVKKIDQVLKELK